MFHYVSMITLNLINVQLVLYIVQAATAGMSMT